MHCDQTRKYGIPESMIQALSYYYDIVYNKVILLLTIIIIHILTGIITRRMLSIMGERELRLHSES